ncbi:MAG: DNA/RNA non-specific endonuclease [Lentimicrobiaceae bacterium]|nr:DNA/RNA non-specific endonuclease [Lentimicrobiaceae bacterium]
MKQTAILVILAGIFCACRCKQPCPVDDTGEDPDTIAFQGDTLNEDSLIPVFVAIENLEFPNTEAEDEIISHTGYSFVYNEEHEQANWVAYMLCRERTKKVVNRKDHFRHDPAVKTGTAESTDYTNSGYERGHLAPFADMAWSEVAMSESFFMSNISPHLKTFHQAGGIWYKLEDLVKLWAEEYDTLYIVAGPALTQGIRGSIGKNNVSVPEYFYKVILNYTSGRVEGIGFIMPHETVKSGNPVQDYAVTIDSVQKFTGIDFFYQLPDVQEEQIETTLCIPCWKWKN